ncbi:hypothetical protein XENORESO_016938 [Xenotaenia resolanae]|uniref:Suppressor of white apricot N-terminal domain-containing protein n=1 Tax=Xenotaenia resolanae TaxID=208358 RepID=A0ABV0WUY0_9TELE
MYRRGAAKRDPNNKPVKKDVSDSDKYADLLVFGYACKLFRDDEKALYHEHGKHLIPWMGDKSIMIDRSVEKRRLKHYANHLSYSLACFTFQGTASEFMLQKLDKNRNKHRMLYFCLLTCL